MAFLRKTPRDGYPATGLGRLSIGFGGLVRWVAVPGIGLALASWSIVTVASAYSTATMTTARLVPQTLPMPAKASLGELPKHARLAKAALPGAGEAKTDRLALDAVKPVLPAAAPEDPFATVVARAGLSPQKVLAAFADAGMEFGVAQASYEVASLEPAEARFPLSQMAEPAPGRFGLASLDQLPHHGLAGEPRIELAYAMPSVDPPQDLLDRFAPLLDDQIDEEFEDPGVMLDETIPDVAPLPSRRPGTKAGTNAAPKAETPAPRKPKAGSAEQKPEPDKRKPARRPMAGEPVLAFAKPDNPAGGVFKNLFDKPKARNGVAIYDISAGVVHMPDGSKLEAHSGIGKMADNPKYVHVKMRGPTPPNTYNLSMREKRFHGVEAIRMTPVGKQTMHGRDGMLAHSYLLRGGRPESHGCVAFKDYPRFLKAFKAGKVKQLVVVPSLSRSPVRLARNGDDA